MIIVNNGHYAMNFLTRLKYALLMIILAIIEIGPVPIAAIIGLFIVIFLPRWFKDAVDKMYASDDDK